MKKRKNNFHFPEGSVWECPDCHSFNFSGRSCRCGCEMPVMNRVDVKSASNAPKNAKTNFTPKSVSETGFLESFNFMKGKETK